MTSASIPARRPVLADLIPGALARDAILVLAGALLTAAAAQIEIKIPSLTPVPFTGQTFAVLLSGAALGMGRGALSQGLYLLLASIGLPFYAGGEAGWTHLFGVTGGYLIGFVVAAALVGALAERGFDRGPGRTLVAMALGNAVIYALGVPVLAVVAGMSLPAAIMAGVVPFLLGDALKALLAAGLLPSAWWAVRRVRGGDADS